MKQHFFTIGPSQLYETVPLHIKSALAENILSISHRSAQFKETYKRTISELKTLMNIPSSHEVFFLSSGTEAMERTIESLVEKTSFHITTGAFGERFWQSSTALGNNASKIVIDEKNAADIVTLKIADKPEVICITQNESSNGFAFPANTYSYLKKNNPYSLIVVDAVSSAPVMPIDFECVDVALFSVQKCFGLPSGLACLIISSAALDKARATAQKETKRITYHSITELERYGSRFMTPETPNVLGIYLLGKVAQDMNNRGMENIRKEEAEKAQMLYEFFENSADFELYIKTPDYRSQTIVVIEPNKLSPHGIIESLKKRGYVIGSGYGQYKEKHIRIANYPAHSLSLVRSLIDLF